MNQQKMSVERFVFRRRLASIVLGDINLCEDSEENHRHVAIKRISLVHARQRQQEGRSQENPLREIEITARIQSTPERGHTNILTYHQAFVHQGFLYAVMEFCANGDLYQYLQQQEQNRLKESHAIQLFQQIARGVYFLHTLGIAHRDLSLENILLDQENVCKICDFGLGVMNPMERCREAVGKTYYMAPEVYLQSFYDPQKADIWSLGMILFILITGSPLLHDTTDTALAQCYAVIRTYGIESILKTWGMAHLLSTSTIDLLEQMLHTDPAVRPSIDQVLQHSTFHFSSFF